jgi:hypothetical protein
MKARRLRYSNFLVDSIRRSLWNRHSACFLCSLLYLSGCEKMPETYAPPVQRQPFENFRPYRITRVVNMSDGDVDSHVVHDILGTGGASWRWTGQHPTVRVILRQADNLVYTIDFSIADATFKETGPVTLTFFVNDHMLGSAHYTSPGTYHFEQPVPQGWVQAGKESTLAAEIDKVWVAPQDGAKLGFILSQIGLRQEKSDLKHP